MNQKGLKVSERQRIQRAARDNVLGYGEAAIKHLEDKICKSSKKDVLKQWNRPRMLILRFGAKPVRQQHRRKKE